MTKPFPAFLFLSLVTLAPLDAQAPKGHAVTASFNPGPWNPNNGQGGGLFVVHPRNPGAPFPVGGLPVELTGAGLVPGCSGGVGANAILALPDGDLLVGEIWCSSGPGTTLDVHRVRLTFSASGGWTGTVVRTYPIGTLSTANVSVNDLALLPSGDVLVALDTTLAPPMAGEVLARLNLANGAVTAIPIQGAVTSVNALTMSANGQTVYIGDFVNTAAGHVWALPVAGGAVTQIASLPHGVLNLDRDNQGQLVAGTIGGGPPPLFGVAPNLFRVNPATGTVVVLLPGINGVRNSLLVEKNTGTLLVCKGVDLAYVQGGVQTMLVTGANWGVLAGLAMVPALESFGSQTGGAAPYEWQTEPNPGGLPLLGNLGFSVTMATTAAPSVSLFAFSHRRFTGAPMAVPPFAAWIDPVFVFAGGILGGAAPFAIPIPIPNRPILLGLTAYAQTFHLDSSGPVSSPGLCIQIL